jgi:hypothetical protein
MSWGKLSKLQRLFCLGLRGATRTAPTAAVEILPKLPLLQLKIEAEDWVRIYSINWSE